MPGAVYVMRNATGADVSEAVLFGEIFYFDNSGQLWIMNDELGVMNYELKVHSMRIKRGFTVNSYFDE